MNRPLRENVNYNSPIPVFVVWDLNASLEGPSHISKTLVVESARRDIGGFLLFEDMSEEISKVRKTRLGQFVDVDSGGRSEWGNGGFCLINLRFDVIFRLWFDVILFISYKFLGAVQNIGTPKINKKNHNLGKPEWIFEFSEGHPQLVMFRPWLKSRSKILGLDDLFQHQVVVKWGSECKKIYLNRKHPKWLVNCQVSVFLRVLDLKSLLQSHICHVWLSPNLSGHARVSGIQNLCDLV